MPEDPVAFTHEDGSATTPQATRPVGLAPDRLPCPVLTCTRTVPEGQIMCVACWARVPTLVRVAVDARRRALGRRPSRRNEDRHNAAIAIAIRCAVATP